MDTGGPGIEPSSSKGNTGAHCLGGEGGEGEDEDRRERLLISEQNRNLS